MDERYPKVYFLLNLSHYVKSCGHFCQILAFFYDARSPNMVISHDPRSKFRKFLFCPNSTFNIRKSHKISSAIALYFRSYQPETSRGWKAPPSVPLGLTGEISLTLWRLPLFKLLFLATHSTKESSFDWF